MQLSSTFTTLAVIIASLANVGTPMPHHTLTDADEHEHFVVTLADMLHWIVNTDAELTFVGAPVGPLSNRAVQTTMVTYCSKRAGHVCGGSCTVYNGPATCIAAPRTQCLMATNDVAFCDRRGCNGSCHDLSSCGVRLDNGFCSTPDQADACMMPLRLATPS